MGSRASLNKVLLIGNLTRDPELRYTPSGAAVCTFGVATNRYYTASDGEKKEETEFIKIVSWNKLAELCSQLLAKGRKVYVEGRMQTRSWETPDGQSRQTTEVVIDDMRILDSKRAYEEGSEESLMPSDEAAAVPAEVSADVKIDKKPQGKKGEAVTEPESESNSGAGKQISKKAASEKAEKSDDSGNKDVELDDLPF